MSEDGGKIREAAQQAVIDAANASGSGERVDVINDPSWAVRFKRAWDDGWERNIAPDWKMAFQNPDTTPQKVAPDGFLLGKIADLARTATCLATFTPPVTEPLSSPVDLKSHEIELQNLVEVGQKAAEEAARNLLRRRR